MSLISEQQKMYDILEDTNDNIFVTGKAGSGKSFLLHHFVKNTKKRVIILATTGTAALQLDIKAQTIHSFFKIRPKATEHNLPQAVRNTLKNVDTIIIDEVSMLRADLIEMIDIVIRKAKINKGNSDAPFGGIQMVFFGDLYQLPPVVLNEERKMLMDKYGGEYFFNAPSIKNANIKIYELQHGHRQVDETFLSMLNQIREAKTTRGTARKINERTCSAMPKDVLTIATTNKKAKDINMRNYDNLKIEEYLYNAKIQGEVSPMDYPVEKELWLKVGTKIQMMRNHPTLLWSNGSLGEITKLEHNKIEVCIDGHIHEVNREIWEIIEQVYNQQTKQIEQKTIGTFEQFPMRMAWAITIHKSQGQTYDNVAIDWGSGCFSAGQAYTALSRCKTLENMYMSSEIKPNFIWVEESVRKYMSKAVAL